jgi:hypothetical protein
MMKCASRFFLLILIMLLITACNSSGSGNSTENTGTAFILNGSGVKGPLAGAAVQLYQVDLSQVDLKGALLAKGSTGSDAAINGLTINAGLSGLLLLEFVADADTVEINTGKAPVFDRLVTVFDVQRVYDGASIYASPLTTMAVSIAQNRADSSSPYIGNGDHIISEAEFIAALGFAQNQTKSTVGFGLDTTIDIFVDPPMLTAETNTTAELTAVAQHRQAIEALAAVTVQIAADSTTTSDSAQDVFGALIEDLYDGDIDGQNDGGAVGILLALDVPIEASMAAVNLNALLIPGTTTPVTDVETELAAEMVTTGVTTNTTELEDGTINVILEMPELIADSDGDGVDDLDDVFPSDVSESIDTDNDGVGDNADAFPNDATESADTDNDGVGDNADAFPLDAAESADTDNDGVGDNADAFPNDATESADTDNDGVGDNADAFPLDATESVDTDNDGVGNNIDAFPNDATETLDTDNDLIGNNTDADDDGDGVADTSDAFPLDFTESVDTDNDGVGNNIDAFPNDATETLDTDRDGIGNNADTNDDGDSALDSNDALPLNAAEQVDSDGDGVGNNTDAFDNDPTETLDTDGDTIGNNADTDDDGDGIEDSDDPFPLDATETVDTDGDGVGDNSDPFPTVANLNRPVFTSKVIFLLDENVPFTHTVTATDADGDVVTFRKATSGPDYQLFNIKQSTGALKIRNAVLPLDYGLPQDANKDNFYEVDIIASDGTHEVIQRHTIIIVDVLDAPTFPYAPYGSSNAQTNENSKGGWTLIVSDIDGVSLAFSISGGADQSAFTIDTSSGVWQFISAPDYDVPTDSDGNNSYVVEITATANGTYSNTVTYTVIVRDEDDTAPVFTSSSVINVSENRTATGYIASATDVDSGTITYSLSGGDDESAFSIDSRSGVLIFNDDANFEAPVDSDSDNIYSVDVTASDGVNSTVQTVTVTVDDIVWADDFIARQADMKTIRFSWPSLSGATKYQLFVNPDGSSGYSLLQDNLTGTNTTIELSVHLTDWVNAQYILEAHDGSGKIAETTVISILDLMVSSIGYIKASATASDSFADMIQLSSDGSTLAVTAFGDDSDFDGISTDGSGEDDDSANAAGAVYVFIKVGSSWVQQAYIKASNSDALDIFGHDLSLSSDGNTLAVSAFREASNASGISTDGTGESDNSRWQSGAVYIYTRSGNTWTQQAYIKASNPGVDDEFGYDISLSGDGNTLAVGAHDEDSNAQAISSDGSGGEDNSSEFAGAVYVYSRTVNVWSQQAYIKASNSGESDAFGETVALSEDGLTLAVGARGEDSSVIGISANTSSANNALPNSGAIYVYSRSGSVWSEQAFIKSATPQISDTFPSSMSISSDGNTLVAGSKLSNAAYVFSRSGTSWTQQAYITTSNNEALDRFGWRVALSADSNTLAVTSHNEDSNALGVSLDGSGEMDNSAVQSGAVFIFSRSGSTWQQVSFVKASNTETHDSFGESISLSPDGSVLMVGAPSEQSNAVGVGGDQSDNSSLSSGALYVY